jgi:hypothetical protein
MNARESLKIIIFATCQQARVCASRPRASLPRAAMPAACVTHAHTWYSVPYKFRHPILHVCLNVCLVILNLHVQICSIFYTPQLRYVECVYARAINFLHGADI